MALAGFGAMSRMFGTDGVRGVAGSELSAGLALELAAAAATVLTGPVSESAKRPRAVVGRDSRSSGEFLEAAVVAGLAASGIDVDRLGVLPTPAIAHITAATGANFGVVLSASHNPAADNGIKFFGPGGFKLPDDTESEIEASLSAARRTRRFGPAWVPSGGFGRVRDAAEGAETYLSHLLSTQNELAPTSAAGSIPVARAGRPLAGLRVVVDCAHGAASLLAPRLLRRAGAEVVAIGARPDGENINVGYGSTSPVALSESVVARGADAGLAFDGDADRCVAVDASGALVDGDQILAVLAVSLKSLGRLAGDTVVATVMSNLGFRLAMRKAGISVVETAVGDRHLIAAMLAGDYVLGGEQSGHIIMREHATTGDGMLTGLHLLGVVARSGRPLADLAAVMRRYPQVLISVAVADGADKAAVAQSAGVAAAVAAAKAALGETGRTLIRPSGTESAVRVMVEAADSGQASQVARELAAAVEHSAETHR